MKYEIRSTVENGILKRNRNLLIDAINSFEGQQVVVTIEKAKKKRSNPQNCFYWGCVIPIMQSALKEVGELEIDFICPVHGYVWRKHPERIIEDYVKWATKEVQEGVVVC